MRPDVERAFAHLRDNPAQAETSPEAQLAATRRFVDHYGDAGGAVSLEGIRVEDVRIGQVAAQWVVADGASARHRLVYLHGGAWIAGGFMSHRGIAANLSRLAGCPVLLVDYRLAPEHPFPAGLDDCLGAIRWARGGPAGDERAVPWLTVAGDSAGANLAAAACVVLAERGEPLPDRLALMSPPLDGEPDSTRDTPGDPVVNSQGMAGVMAMYTQGVVPLTDARVSPLCCDPATLRRFPPTLLQASASEYLRADAQRFFDRLHSQDVRACFSLWPGMPHAWQLFQTLLPEAREALREVASFCAPERPA